MRSKCFSTALLAGATLIISALASPVSAAFIVPDGATPPFTDWSRSDADSMYAEWNSFTVPNGAPGNPPDVGSFGPATANIQQNGAFAIITSGGNIYSFAGATDFDVTVPNYGYGAGYDTRVAVQLLTLGNPLDATSMQLTFNDGSANQTLSPTQSVGPTPDSGGEQWLFVWDIPSFNPSSMLVEFNASASSMSFDRFVVDTFTQVVPEPATFVLSGVGLCGSLAVARGRRSRQEVASS